MFYIHKFRWVRVGFQQNQLADIIEIDWNLLNFEFIELLKSEVDCISMWKGEQCKRCTFLNAENAGQWDRRREPSLVSFIQKEIIARAYWILWTGMEDTGLYKRHYCMQEKFAVCTRVSILCSNYPHKFSRKGMYSCTFLYSLSPSSCL